jgi:pimeloyl-[acyl-carrier protein] methyl ester esterase
MRPVILFVHGWGFDADFWTPVRLALKGIETVAWDLGFHGAAARPALSDDRPVVAVGHSFGVLWLLRERPVAWRSLVSINGFRRFTRAEDFPEGIAPRSLHRMIARLAETPQTVYRDFMERCGIAQPRDDGLVPKALLDGLRALADWDCRAGRGADFVLAGRSDPLVSAAMTEVAFAGQAINWHDGGHLLPLTAPDWCAERLLHVLELGA